MLWRTCIGLAAAAVTGCASIPWQARAYPDQASVGRLLFDQTTKLQSGRLRPTDLLPALQDRRSLFADDAQRIAVRDIAVGILDEAGVVGFPSGAAPVFICSCKVGDEGYRFHVPLISEEEFAQIITAIQSAPRD